jgi:shikimate kinase
MALLGQLPIPGACQTAFLAQPAQSDAGQADSARLARQSQEISVAVAWATEGDVTDAILQSGKVSCAVIGTHM